MDQNNFVQLEFPANVRHLKVLGACIRAMLEEVPNLSNAADTIYQIELAVHEICNNVIEHAYSTANGRIVVGLELNTEEHYFCADVSDQGIPFDLSSLSEPNLDEPQEDGYGVFLARQLMDSVEYASEKSRNRWRLMKKLSGLF